MYAYHTTEAFILQAFPQGESNKVYKLLTRELGLLYAHGQSVRELRNRNRYVLQTGDMLQVTLVRGRETWRITTAQGTDEKTVPQEVRIYKQRILHLLGTLVPVEDVNRQLFDILKSANSAFRATPGLAALIEVVTVLRLLDILGYVARPLTEPMVEMFLGTWPLTLEILSQAEVHKQVLVGRVNNALIGSK